MTNLVFLEAAAQSDSAAEIIESNEALINFATAEVDSLVEEQALHTSCHVGSFVEESFDITYENMTDPISDIVVEATSIFADVIASDGYSDSEKKELIEGYAHIIAMGDSELIAEIRSTKANMGLLSGIGGSVFGASFGAGNGAISGFASSLFSKERKEWKKLIQKEKRARDNGDDRELKRILHSKEIALNTYKQSRNSKILKHMKYGAVAGMGIGGAVGVSNGVMLYNNKIR